ncbi:MAG: class I SAM-dependent methyltransferase [Dehalococcoidia bacterium]
MSDDVDQQQGAYIFQNADEPTADRFSGLAAVFDPGSFRHLSALGVGPGWHCLEVGGGGGSVARWLSERVGPSGRVVVTDIDTRHLGHLIQANVTVQQHDITADPLPAAAFDLIHARLVLLHLPQREQVLTRLITALKPGGWLLAEEFDALSMSTNAADNPGERFLKLEEAQQRLMRERGADTAFGRRLPARFAAHDLVNIDAEGQVFFWHGGSAGAQIKRANYLQLQDAILAAGYVSAEELTEELQVLADSTSLILSPVMWSVRGQRPGGE